MSTMTVFPAGAGVIPIAKAANGIYGGVSRRRGGDPHTKRRMKNEVMCFPQARG